LYGLEGRYAHAIYAAAARNGQLDAVDKDFQGILVGYLSNFYIQLDNFLKVF
jgi:hypothetical protein